MGLRGFLPLDLSGGFCCGVSCDFRLLVDVVAGAVQLAGEGGSLWLEGGRGAVGVGVDTLLLLLPFGIIRRWLS